MLPDEAHTVGRGGGGESGLAGGAGCCCGGGAGWSDEPGGGVGSCSRICGGDDGDDCRDARDDAGRERRCGGARGKRSKGFVERVCRTRKRQHEPGGYTPGARGVACWVGGILAGCKRRG